MENKKESYPIFVRNLTKKFGDFVAVNQISFEVSKGEIFGFLGANGAGKTTAMRMLCGLSKASSGTAFVAGYSIDNQADQIKKSIGYMSQKFSLYDDLTVLENIRFYGGIYGMDDKVIQSRSLEVIEKLHLLAEKNTLVQELPLGWKQKLSFSVAMFHQPAIIFLDEPTGGVDPVTRREFWQMIYEASAQQTTIFVTTHYMDEAEYCDRISIMVDGDIAALGTPKELKQYYQADNMDQVFYLMARKATKSGD